MENRDEKQRKALHAELYHDPRPKATGRELGPSQNMQGLMAAIMMGARQEP